VIFGEEDINKARFKGEGKKCVKLDKKIEK